MVENIAIKTPASGRGHDDEENASMVILDKVICGYIRDEGDDLSMRQMAVLIQIAQTPMEVTPLAKQLQLSLSSVSRSIDALVKLKLAKRVRNGRNVTASTTPLGSAKVGRLISNLLADRCTAEAITDCQASN